MKYKLIENCHMENAILGKDLSLGAIDSLFLFSSHSDSKEGFCLLNPIKCNQPHNICHNLKV
jgi:hypothetical protein